MKNKIKNSIEEIKLSNSQKKDIYDKIMYKKNYSNQIFVKLSFICCAFILCITLVNTPSELNNEPIMIRSTEIYYENDIYDQIDVPYEVGNYLTNEKINGIYYDIYENALNEDSIILYNDFYEVYVKR